MIPLRLSLLATGDYLMVKNISNPLNARRVAEILSQDAQLESIILPEREISVFLSDNQFDNVIEAVKSLKDKGTIPKEFVISRRCINTLLEQDFITDDMVNLGSVDQGQLDSVPSADRNKSMKETSLDSIDLRNQFESLKKKVIKMWSGGLAIDRRDLDKFEVKFTKPMKSFTSFMQERGKNIDDLMAYAVIFAADHLGLSDDSRENIYHLIFGRFEELRTIFADRYDIYFSWPETMGSTYIEIGKRFSIGPEISDFAIKLKTISGLDTYSDAVIQELFKQLIRGDLTGDLISRKTIFRWAEKEDRIEQPLDWIIPPMGYNVMEDRKSALIQATLAHTILGRIGDESISLETLFDQIYKMNSNDRVQFLARKLEHVLTRNSVALQFGTTLANFYENFKTNPSKSAPFIDTTLRYFQKAESVEVLIQQMQHSMTTGLKNSIGLIKKYLRNIPEEELNQQISSILYHALESTIPLLEGFSNFTELPYTPDLLQNYEAFNTILYTFDEDQMKLFFTQILDHTFRFTQEFARNLEPESKEPQIKEGGLTELTQDFLSTVIYHANKHPEVKEIVGQYTESTELPVSIIQMIAQITSYLTYQVAGKEGERARMLHLDLVRWFIEKISDLSGFKLKDNTLLGDADEFLSFINEEMTQSHVLISLASKTKTEVFNAWTPLTGTIDKSTLYLNEFVIPNLLYWQRLPKSLIESLVKKGKIESLERRSLVAKTNRLNMIEAYALLVVASKYEVNTMLQAFSYLAEVFNQNSADKDAIQDVFALQSKTGEAEIVQEISYLWFQLNPIARRDLN
jgi:hypothetical protein